MNIFEITSNSSNSEITDAYYYGGFNINKLAQLTKKTAQELIDIIEEGIVDEELADIGRRQEANQILRNFGIV